MKQLNAKDIEKLENTSVASAIMAATVGDVGLQIDEEAVCVIDTCDISCAVSCVESCDTTCDVTDTCDESCEFTETGDVCVEGTCTNTETCNGTCSWNSDNTADDAANAPSSEFARLMREALA